MNHRKAHSRPLPDPSPGSFLDKLIRVNAVQATIKEFGWMPLTLLEVWDTTDSIERDAIEALIRKAKEDQR